MTSPEGAAPRSAPGGSPDDHERTVELKPLAQAGPERVAGWLSREENYAWLHFGAGRQTLDAVTLRVMDERDLHLLRAFAPDGGEEAIGLVALSDIDPRFRTASLWYLLGEKEHAREGYTTRAVDRLLTLAFDDLALEAIHAWTVETNEPSRKLLRRLGFTLTGRQRQCHRIDGVAYDRLLFDLLVEEYENRPTTR